MDRLRRMFGIKKDDSGQDFRKHTPESDSNVIKADEDCLACKAVSTLGTGGGAAYVMYHYNQKRGKYTGIEGMAWSVMCIGIASGLVVVGVCRLFDVGMFRKDRNDRNDSKNSVQSSTSS